MSSNKRDLWESLNKRQQQALRCIYDTDQFNESERQAEAARGNWDSTPAAVWRWMLYATLQHGDTELKEQLRSHDLVTEGLGSTLEALERRKLIEVQYNDKGTPYEGQMAPNDPQWYLFVKITTLGRAVVRAGDTSYKPAKKLPVGTLKERQWEALEALYKAGETGLQMDTGKGDYGDFSWSYTLLRLRDYRRDKQDYPLLKEVRRYRQVMKRDIYNHGPDYPSTVTDYFVVITDQGRAYYEEKREFYRALYKK